LHTPDTWQNRVGTNNQILKIGKTSLGSGVKTRKGRVTRTTHIFLFGLSNEEWIYSIEKLKLIDYTRMKLWIKTEVFFILIFIMTREYLLYWLRDVVKKDAFVHLWQWIIVFLARSIYGWILHFYGLQTDGYSCEGDKSHQE
jgi:hypothetical protein